MLGAKKLYWEHNKKQLFLKGSGCFLRLFLLSKVQKYRQNGGWSAKCNTFP